MRYQKREGAQGVWLKAKELTTGAKATLVSETIPVESTFEGKSKTQDVAKIRVKGDDETYNISLNRTTLNGLIDAFGDDSKNWVNKILTVHTEKAVIGGKRVTVLYLLPEGYDLKEDESGYLFIAKSEGDTEGDQTKDEHKEEEINPDEIPF